MATKIVTKNSSTASAVPTTGDLVQGELAVNVADKRLFTEDNAGAIVELGTNPSTIDINAGSIDGTTIGASSASTGAFTTLTATGIDVTGTATMDGLEIATTASDTGVELTLNGNKSSNGGVGSIIFENAGDSVGMIRSNRASANDAADMLFYTQATGGANTERMRIDSSGNVGIGGSPNSYAGQTALTINSAGVARLDLDINNAYQGYLLAEAGYIGLYAQSGNYISMGISGVGEAMRIDSSGRVGIGTSSPSAAQFSSTPNGVLNVSGTKPVVYLTEEDETDSNVWMGLSNGVGIIGNTGDGLAFRTGASTATERMRIDTSGNLLVGYSAADGIGGAPSDNNFSELGKGYINLNRDDTATARQIQFGKNGVVAGYIQTTGSATSYVTSSDQRLKENIADADDAGSKIDAIQVRKYDWKADGSHQDYGMIAQELQTVAPEAVSGDADSEEMMGVDYSKLVPMLIKEIQSLRNRVAQLEE
jgi:hypothetical protein